MKRSRRVLILLGAVVVAAAVGGAAMAATGGGEMDDVDAGEGPDVPITGEALEHASEAALEYVGEGRVTATEVGDEESYYEVEVTRADGSEIDVQLDEDFNVVGTD